MIAPDSTGRIRLANMPTFVLVLRKKATTDSAVMLRFDVALSPNLPEAVKARLAVLAGSSIGAVNKLVQSERYGTLSRILKIVMGVLILLIGLYLLYLGF